MEESLQATCGDENHGKDSDDAHDGCHGSNSPAQQNGPLTPTVSTALLRGTACTVCNNFALLQPPHSIAVLLVGATATTLKLVRYTENFLLGTDIASDLL